MKKILIMLLAVLLFLPTISIFAYDGGLLNGKLINRGQDQFGINSTFPQITDNDESTSVSMSPQGTTNDTVWYEFENPVNLTAYQAKTATVGSNFQMVFYTETGSALQTFSPTTGSKVNRNANGVKKIALINASGSTQVVYEIDVFGVEESTGLLNGKTLNYSNQLSLTPNGVTNTVTDGNTATNFALNFNGNSQKTVYYQFSQPLKIDAYSVDVSTLDIGNHSIKFYDSNKNLKTTLTGFTMTGTKKYITPIEDVSYVSYQYAGTTANIALREFNVYGFKPIPIITHDPANNLNETHTYNSINLEWINPTGEEFTGTIIKQNGVEINQLGKTINSLEINGLVPETTYSYEIIAKYSDGINSTPLSKSITTDSAPLPPEPVGEVIDLSATATHERVNLSWTLPESEELKHVNIYRDVVTQTSFIDSLLGISTAYAAETKIFETNGTYFNDLTVSEETTYEYTLTTTSTEGVESEGITTEVTTPEAPAPEIVGGGYEKDPITGDFTYYWTEPTEGEVKVLVGGTEYQKVAASTKQIVIPASEMKYTAFGDPNVTLIPIALDGDEGAPIKPPLNGEGSPDSIGNVNIPFSATELLKSGMGLFIIIAPFVLLALSFLLVPKLRFLLVQAFTKKEHRAENKRRFESETREREERKQRERTDREQRTQTERAERKERLQFKEKTIGTKGSRESVIVKAERAPKQRKERAERQSRSTREKTERAARERTPRTERGFR